MGDFQSVNDAVKAKDIVKTKACPKPDYQQMIADGIGPAMADAIKQIYDSRQGSVGGLAGPAGAYGTGVSAGAVTIIVVLGAGGRMISFGQRKKNSGLVG